MLFQLRVEMIRLAEATNQDDSSDGAVLRRYSIDLPLYQFDHLVDHRLEYFLHLSGIHDKESAVNTRSLIVR